MISVIIMTFIGITSFKGIGPYIWPIPFFLIFVGIIIKEWLRPYRHKCLVSLRVGQKTLVYEDDSEVSQTKEFSNIKNYNLAENAYIEFCDGTKMLDMDKLRYWPILRKYLSAKLNAPSV